MPAERNPLTRVSLATRHDRTAEGVYTDLDSLCKRQTILDRDRSIKRLPLHRIGASHITATSNSTGLVVSIVRDATKEQPHWAAPLLSLTYNIQ